MIGDEIKLYRKRKGMTQVQLADTLNLAQSTIASWEKNTRRPDIDLLPTIAKVLGVAVSDLYGGAEPIADEYQDDAMRLRDRLRNDPALRLLFDAAGRASPDHIRAAAEMLKALEKKG